MRKKDRIKHYYRDKYNYIINLSDSFYFGDKVDYPIDKTKDTMYYVP